MTDLSAASNSSGDPSGVPPPRSTLLRRRFMLGLAVSVAVGVVAAAFLQAQARREIAKTTAERSAVASARALADVIERLGADGDKSRAVVKAWNGEGEPATAARLFLFDGLSLEASSFPTDSGEKVAPRRLDRSEKEVFDQATRLKTGVQTNREEGSSRKPEIEVQVRPDRTLLVSVPVEQDGNVVGMVQTLSAAPERPLDIGWGLPFVLWLSPLVLMLAVCAIAGENRLALALGAAALLLVTLFTDFGSALDGLKTAKTQGEEQVARVLVMERGRAQGILQQGAPDKVSSLAPGNWDADLYRKPFGLIDAGALKPNPDKVETDIALGQSRAKKGLGALTALSLVLLLGIGLGGAAALLSTLHTHRQAYVYVTPAIFGMLVLVFFPFAYGVALSFTDANIYNSSAALPEIWVGLKNYVDILSDVHVASRGADGSWAINYLNFYWTLFFTIVWTVTNVAIGVTAGLILALVLNTKGLAMRPVYRVLLILPWAMPNYITALIWKGMFHQQFGVVNQVLQLLHLSPVAWFEKPFTSFLTALATNGWLSFPFMMVVSLGALQSIPADLYEAARVDGANRWQQFTAITLPALRPALIPSVILSVVWTFNMFNIIYLVTGGEPASSTEILITQAYKFAFERYRYGYAAAYSTVIFGILLIYGQLQNRLSRATEAA